MSKSTFTTIAGEDFTDDHVGRLLTISGPGRPKWWWEPVVRIRRKLQTAFGFFRDLEWRYCYDLDMGTYKIVDVVDGTTVEIEDA